MILQQEVLKMNKFEITYKDKGETFLCKEDECLLEAMKRSHKGPVDTGCFGGGCGRCKIQILEGDYNKFKKMSRAHISEEEEAKGIVLACCTKPLGNIVLTGFKATEGN